VLEICMPMLLGIGCLMIVAGVHGVRRGSAPHCSGCEFDLSGSDLTGVCPECGIGLLGKGAWRTGARRRSPWLAVLGLVLTLPLCVMLTYRLSSQSNAAAMARYKPMWILRSDIAMDGISDRPVALGEVQRRITDPNFTNWEGVQGIVRDLLAIQADPNARWDREMGDLVLAVRAAGHVSDEDFAKFIANSAVYQVKLPEYVQAGAEFEVQIDAHHARTSTRPMRVATYVAMTANENARPLWSQEMNGSGSFRFRVRAPAETGVAEVQATLDFVQATVLSGSRLLKRSTNVIPSDQLVPIQGIADPSILEELQRHLVASLEKVEAIPSQSSYRTVTIHWITPDAAVSNVDFVFRVMVRGRHASGDAFELDVGQLRRWQRDEAMAYVYSLQRFEEAGELRGAVFEDVVLKVDRDGVLRALGVLRPWTGEDVVVRVSK
jgi:hypothetical protein